MEVCLMQVAVFLSVRDITVSQHADLWLFSFPHVDLKGKESLDSGTVPCLMPQAEKQTSLGGSHHSQSIWPSPCLTVRVTEELPEGPKMAPSDFIATLGSFLDHSHLTISGSLLLRWRESFQKWQGGVVARALTGRRNILVHVWALKLGQNTALSLAL